MGYPWPDGVKLGGRVEFTSAFWYHPPLSNVRDDRGELALTQRVGSGERGTVLIHASDPSHSVVVVLDNGEIVTPPVAWCWPRSKFPIRALSVFEEVAE